MYLGLLQGLCKWLAREQPFASAMCKKGSVMTSVTKPARIDDHCLATTGKGGVVICSINYSAYPDIRSSLSHLSG